MTESPEKFALLIGFACCVSRPGAWFVDGTNGVACLFDLYVNLYVRQ